MSEALIGITDAPARAMISVRGALESAEFINDLKGMGVEVPQALGLSGDATSGALWFSPDELLVFADAGQGPAKAAELTAALAGQHAMALDVTDARIAFRLTGPKVGEVLAKGAPCDCSDAGFPPGTVRRTHLAGLAVVVWRLEADTWEIGCFRSFAHHLKTWLHTVSAPETAVNY